MTKDRQGLCVAGGKPLFIFLQMHIGQPVPGKVIDFFGRIGVAVAFHIFGDTGNQHIQF